VKRKAVTPAELAAQAEAAVARLNPKLEAVLEVFADVVADPNADRPERDGALYGVPMFLKDLGSGLKKGNVAKATDPTVENYLRAGLVPIGRSTTPEFGMTFDTTTDYLGAVKVTRNPWDLAHTPGGSAAAVAAGIVPISMSSDGGGSTRIPASFCGLVGLKASRGSVPRPLMQSECIQRISVDGVVTRSVRDSAAAFDYMIRVPNGGSFIKMGPPAGSYVEAITREPRRLKIRLSTGPLGGGGATDPEVADRMRRMGTLLAGLGHHVEEVADAAICDWEALWWSYITQWISCRGQPIPAAKAKGIDAAGLKDWLGPMTDRHSLAAARYDKFDIWKMMECNNTVTRAFGRTMENYDLLLTRPWRSAYHPPTDPTRCCATRNSIPGCRAPRRCLPLYHARQRDRHAGDLAAGWARPRRAADRRSAPRQFRAGGSAPPGRGAD
jgi:amidase